MAICVFLCVKCGYYCRGIVYIGLHHVCTYIDFYILYIVAALHSMRSVVMSCSMSDFVLNLVFLWYSKSPKGHGTRSSSVFRSWKTDKTCCAVWRRSEPLFPHLSLFQPIVFVFVNSPIKLYICSHSYCGYVFSLFQIWVWTFNLSVSSLWSLNLCHYHFHMQFVCVLIIKCHLFN